MKEPEDRDDHLDHDVKDSSTYPIQESTSAFLELAFGLKKPIDNKTRNQSFKFPNVIWQDVPSWTQ